MKTRRSPVLTTKITLMLAIAAFAACGKNSTTSSTTATTTTSTVIADASVTAGSYRDVVGMNKAPRGADSQSFGSNMYNVAALYQALGLSTVRTLDSSMDICSVYTDKTLTNLSGGAAPSSCTATQGTHVGWSANSGGANVNNAGSYSFTTTDANLDAIYSSGAGIYLRIGENNNGPNDTTDYTNWATVAKNFYKHVSGASGGFGSAPTHAISPAYIEIFNEPDGSFWMGSKANFYTLYNTTTDAIRAVAPAGTKIGGPAFTNEFQTHLSISSNPAADFVTNVTASRLDFLSGHVYGSCESATLADMVTKMNQLRSYMNSNGLSSKPLIISEWNIGLNCSTDDSFHSARAQSFNGAMMSLMQDSSLNIEKAMYYVGFGMMSFVTMDTSNVGTLTIYPGAWAFKAHSQLIGGTALSTQVCDSSSTCLSGSATYSSPVQATVVSQGGGIKAVLANDTASTASTSLQIKNWTGSSSPNVTVYSYPSTSTTVSATSGAGVYTVSSTAAAALLTASTKTTTGSASISGSTLSTSVSIPSYSAILVTIQ